MRKFITGLLITIILFTVVVVVFPQILYMSAFGQRIAMKIEGDQVAEFYFKENQVFKDTLYMNGVIYSNTLQDIKEVLRKNPQVKTLVMEYVPGSIDDEINLVASQEIRKRNINTYIPKDGMVASGGTDMFLAGVERNIHAKAKIGVHSWSDGERAGTEYPKEDVSHKKYLDYYKSMGITKEFYWYTMEAAPDNGMHWMTSEEIIKYEAVTPFGFELLELQKILSSDEFAGRGTGSNQKAQDLIKTYFENIGLKKFQNSFENEFKFEDAKTDTLRKGTNIIGYVKGKKQPNTYLVIGAHYDHLGIINNKIFNGADDNASGTSALLVLAKYFVKNPPEHSIIFAAFDAEELGLHGSKSFIENPPVSLASIKLNINMDMISRNPKNEIYVVGTYPYPKLKPLIEEASINSPLTISYGHDDPNDITKDYWMLSSDNGPFHKKEIPNITFSEEDHPAYHKATDDFQDINPEFYKNVVAFIKKSVIVMDTNFSN